MIPTGNDRSTMSTVGSTDEKFVTISTAVKRTLGTTVDPAAASRRSVSKRGRTPTVESIAPQYLYASSVQSSTSKH